MNFISKLAALAIICSSLACNAETPKQTDAYSGWYRGWEVEQAVNSAQLVLVAKVTQVGKVKVVEGAKTKQFFREFHFQPIKQIKGVYSRDELVMSAADLGCRSSTGTDASDIQEGQLRILILSQSSPLNSTLGCVSSTSSKNFRQSVPLLTGLDDPIITMFETMCRLSSVRSSKERVNMLIKSLATTDGPAAIPLLTSLRKYPIWSAAHQGVVAPLARIAKDERTAIRLEAIECIGSILHWADNTTLSTDQFSEIMRDVLKQKNQKTRIRLTAIRALANLKGQLPWRTETLLKIAHDARTYQERIAAIIAIGKTGDRASFDKLATMLKELPLDANFQLEEVLCEAILTIDQTEGTKQLMARLRESHQAGQPCHVELNMIAKFELESTIPELVELLRSGDASLQGPLIQLFTHMKSPAAVERLGQISRSNTNQAHAAMQALMAIGTKQAAIELRPMLKTERNLGQKLKIAKLLAQHGFDDGFSMAVEHLADQIETSVLAADVLSEMSSERVEKQLMPIFTSNPDEQWYAASLGGLLAVKNRQALETIEKILADDRHPIIVNATRYAQFADPKLVVSKITKLVESRNLELSQAALQTLSILTSPESDEAKLSSKLDVKQAKVRVALPQDLGPTAPLIKTLQDVLADNYIAPQIREKALSVLANFPIEESSETLIELFDRNDVKSSNINYQIQNLILKEKVAIPEFGS